MGIFSTPMAFALADKWACDYWSAEENAIDCGYNNNAVSVGKASVALGRSNTASGYYSSAVGYNNIANGYGSSAVGRENNAGGMYTSALGLGNTTEGQYSSALGNQSKAVVDYGTAIGYKSYANRAAWDSRSNNYSAAFVPSDMSAFNAKQKAAWQATSAALAVGDPNGTGNSTNTIITRQITGVAAGSEDTDAVNVAQLKEVAGMVGSGGTAFSPITVSGNSGSGFTVGSAGKLNIQGDGTNITTTAESGTVTIGLSSALKTQITNAIATVGTLNTTVTNLGTTVAGLETEIKAVETNVVAYDGRITANKDKITQLENNHNALSGEVTNISNAMANKADQSWVTDQINNAALGGTGVDLSEYAKTADANAYADTAANTAENNAKGYTDSEVAKAKSYADTAANTAETNAKGYTDSKLGDYSTTTDMNKAIDTAKADANKYADTAANKAKTDANAYTDGKLADNATQSWVNNQQFAKQQAVTDLNSRVDKLVVTGGGYEHITVAGENGSFNVANKETAKFVGDGKNITTDATGGEVKISLADDIAVNSVNAGGTVVNQNGVALPSGVALTNGGLNNGGQVISNVAPGVRPTDAVNVSQLNNAMGGVYGRIDSVEKHANAGIAQAMATGAMMTSTQAGQGFLSLSGSTYRGEQGYAMGYSHMSDSGKWGVKFIGSGNSRGKFGGAASVGFRLY
ncbi:MAG: YadA-like family protein, partial [Neisseriaceae bacterium]|nr:YadA-like family protein [Neisseriaceae bacterium]